jgi:hypothetical protein
LGEPKVLPSDFASLLDPSPIDDGRVERGGEPEEPLRDFAILLNASPVNTGRVVCGDLVVPPTPGGEEWFLLCFSNPALFGVGLRPEDRTSSGRGLLDGGEIGLASEEWWGKLGIEAE